MIEEKEPGEKGSEKQQQQLTTTYCTLGIDRMT